MKHRRQLYCDLEELGGDFTPMSEDHFGTRWAAPADLGPVVSRQVADTIITAPRGRWYGRSARFAKDTSSIAKHLYTGDLS